MNLRPVKHFCPPYFLRSTLIWKKNGRQKCSTGQRFIFTAVTFYKIHILAVAGPVIQANGRLEFEDGSPAALCVTLNLSSASTWTLWGEPGVARLSKGSAIPARGDIQQLKVLAASSSGIALV